MVAGAFAGWLAVYLGGDAVGRRRRRRARRRGVRPAARVADRAAGAVAARVGARHHAARDERWRTTRYRVSFPKVDTPPTIQPFAADAVAADSGARRADAADAAGAAAGAGGRRTCCYRTPVGLAVRMVGENPRRPRGRASIVAAMRTGAIVAGSALMGVAGAFLTLSAFNAFFFNMVNGRGWICVALVVFASWRPGQGACSARCCSRSSTRCSCACSRRAVRLAVPDLPDAALRAVDPGAGAGGAPRELSAGADEAVSQGRTMSCRRESNGVQRRWP